MSRNDLASLRDGRSGSARLPASSGGGKVELADSDETRPLIVHEADSADHARTGMEYLDTEVI